MNNPEILLQCKQLCKRLHRFEVKNVDLTLHKGEILALLGPSGCGKTTALRMLAGFERPDSGTIYLNGQLVEGGNMHILTEKRNLGMVFQEYALFPHLNVFENVAFSIRKLPKSTQITRVKQLLDLVRLAGNEAKMPHELSGGQQQRIALARALLPNPGILLLDEPFSNLDVRQRVDIRRDISRILRKTGVTAILVTHDQEEALSFADRVAVMFDGEIIQVDTPENIYRHPDTLQVATFLGDANLLAGTVQKGTVTTPLGRWPAANLPGGAVTIMIRPEDVSLIQDSAGIGEVARKTFMGYHQLIELKLPDGNSFKVRLLGSNNALAPGAAVQIKVKRFKIFP